VDRRGGHLSPAEREELGYEAYELSLKRYTYREIARELSLNKDTVAGLVHEERARRRLEHFAEIQQSADTYAAVEREAWQRLSGSPPGRPNLATVGLLNTIVSARTRRDLLLGLDAPKKADIRQRIERIDLSRLNDAELESVEAALQKATVRELEGG
jgi:DNA-binding CsgD family transcriptional regulator